MIAINAAVLFSVYKSYPDFRPIKEAYFQMANAVVFHDEDANTDSVLVFDLSKRDALSSEILKQAVIKMTDDCHYLECKNCPLFNSCVVHKK